MKYLLEADSIPITKDKYVVLGSDSACHIQDNTKFTGDIVTLTITNNGSYLIFQNMTGNDLVNLYFTTWALYNSANTKIIGSYNSTSSSRLYDVTEYNSSGGTVSAIAVKNTDTINTNNKYLFGARPPVQEGDQ